jgi:hypothetical protein
MLSKLLLGTLNGISSVDRWGLVYIKKLWIKTMSWLFHVELLLHLQSYHYTWLQSPITL